MTDAEMVKGAARGSTGSRAARRMREEGLLPGIIYGHGEPPKTISVNTHDMIVALTHGARTVKLDYGEGEQQLLIKDVQYDHLGHDPVHVDLMRVNLDEKVSVMVAVEIKGEAKGIAEGGVLDQQLTEIEVECLVTNIPDHVVAKVENLGIGEGLHVKDLALPEGVTALTDPNERVVGVSEVSLEEESTTVGEDGEAAQPEVIGRGKKEEEGEEG